MADTPDFLESYELDDQDDAHDFTCGQLPDGTCMNAGTEWCDFECPYSD